MPTGYKNLVGLVVTIIIPAIILTKFSDGVLGPVGALWFALAWPLTYGGYQFYRAKKADFLAVIGLAGVLLTGGIGLLQLDARWLAVKEAAIPLTIATAIIISARAKYSLVEVVMAQLLAIDKVKARLVTDEAQQGYQLRLKKATGMIAASFLLSAVLNYVLAKIIVKSPAGTEAFNVELGRLTVLSYPFIALPALAMLIGGLVYLISGIEKHTGLKWDDVLLRHND